VAEPVQTGMRLHDGEDWPTRGHVVTPALRCDHNVPNASIMLRRIGWLDQRGMVWLSDREWMAAGSPNGSITPLLISAGCD
jgi:hypothetical protein